MNETININQLTPEQRKALLTDLENEQANEAKRITEGRKAYKDLVNQHIPLLFAQLVNASGVLTETKINVFEGVKTLIEMKQDVYGRDDDQYTHTFSTDAGITLMLGSRTTDNWDDTITAGLKKIDDYIKSLIKDENSAYLVGFITDLLTTDKKGNLSAKNVLKLRKKANEKGDLDFIDGVNIILDAYKPIRGKSFISAFFKNGTGERCELALDITSIELPEKKEDSE